MPSRMAYIGQSSLVAISNPSSPELAPRADITSDFGRTYSGGGERGSEELEKTLDCMWERESSRGANMLGDNGMAYGHYQIWISLHPVSYDCAMDYECSRGYAREMILRGQGWLWTSYKNCI